MKKPSWTHATDAFGPLPSFLSFIIKAKCEEEMNNL
jgi:hypothetical protein